MKASRRTLLRASTAGSLLAGVSPLASLLSRAAVAAEVAPRRLLVLYLPNSSIVSRWTPTGGRNVSAATGDATSFSFNEANAPLQPVKSYLTLIDGLANKFQGSDLHSAPLIKFMTGAPCGRNNLGTAPSIDQTLLAKSPVLRGAPVGSVQFLADTRSDRNDIHHRVMSYDRAAQPMPAENQPHLAYMRLIGKAASTPGAGGLSPQTLELQRAREKSVIDFVKADLSRLSGRVGQNHRMRLDAHLEAVRELERGFDRPAAPQTITTSSGLEVLEPNVSANHPKVVSGFLKTLKTAFQLDVTRVATFGFATANSYVQFGAFQPGFSNEGVHAITHVDMKEGGRAGELVKITRWYCTVVANFVAELQATRDVDGRSLLDNTLIVLFSEVSQHHRHENLPVVLFGGSQLGLRGGRVLRYKSRLVNDLWTTIAPAFGVELPAFGNSEENKGPLPELWG